MKIDNANLRLINEAIRKQLEAAGRNLQDMVPDLEKMVNAIRRKKQDIKDDN